MNAPSVRILNHASEAVPLLLAEVRALAARPGRPLLGFATGFRLRGKYWSWRMETAFGADRSKWPPAHERRRAALEYGAWVGSMRRMMRDRA